MNKREIIELNNVCSYVSERIGIDRLTLDNYVSTENMVSNKEGIIKSSGLPKTNAVRYRKGDVLVSNIRPYFKKIWFADREGGCSADVLNFRANKNCNSKFLYYVLSDDEFFRYSVGTSRGTKMPRGDKAALLKYSVPKISIAEQERIVEILSVFDDKIKINKKINENLEQQAQAIFNKMFVENYSAEWKQGVLSDISIITMGQSPSGSSYNEDGDGMVFFQGRTDFGFRFPTQRLFTTEPKRIAESNDILMSVRAPVGDLNIATEKCCIGRGLGAIKSKDNHQSFVLYTMFALKTQLDVFNGEGTVFGSINRDSLNSMPIVIPSLEEMDKFESIVSPMDKMIRNNYEENCRLQALRDSLLPKLMLGEIDVLNVVI